MNVNKESYSKKEKKSTYPFSAFEDSLMTFVEKHYLTFGLVRRFHDVDYHLERVRNNKGISFQSQGFGT